MPEGLHFSAPIGRNGVHIAFRSVGFAGAEHSVIQNTVILDGRLRINMIDIVTLASQLFQFNAFTRVDTFSQLAVIQEQSVALETIIRRVAHLVQLLFKHRPYGGRSDERRYFARGARAGH